MKEPAPPRHITAFGATALELVLWADAFGREGITIPKPGPSRVILEQPPQA